MTSPDVAAADYVPLWRSRPLPQPGDRIKMIALIRRAGSTFLSEQRVTGVVDTVAYDTVMTPRTGTVSNDMTIRLLDDPTDYILRQGSPTCDWALEAVGPREPTEEVVAEPVAPIDPASIVALERRLLQIQTRLKALDGEADTLKAEVAVLNEQIRQTALDEEMESLPAVDGMTAYFSPVYHVERNHDEATGKPYTSADLMQALRDSGHQYLIAETANGNQVRALAREIVVDHERPLPPALAKVITLRTRYEVRFTPMGERKRRGAPRREH